MSDTVTKHVRALYAELKIAAGTRDAGAARGAPDLEEAAAEALASLLRAIDLLHAKFRALIAAGDIEEAREVKAVMDQIAAVSIGINRAVIAFLDDAADVAAAKLQVESAGKDLVREAERVKNDTADLDDVASALDVITQIVKL